MRKLIGILLVIGLVGCSQKEVDVETQPDLQAQVVQEVTKAPVGGGYSGIVGGEGVEVKSDGKTYTMPQYILLKMEYAYFEGQKEALEGDVRISDINGCLQWTKSPWDGNTLESVLYTPVCEEPTTYEDEDIYDTHF